MKKALVVRAMICFVSATMLPGRMISAQAFGTEQDWEQLVRTPAVSGYEQKLAEQIRAKLKGLSPMRWSRPHRLRATSTRRPRYSRSSPHFAAPAPTRSSPTTQRTPLDGWQSRPDRGG